MLFQQHMIKVATRFVNYAKGGRLLLSFAFISIVTMYKNRPFFALFSNFQSLTCKAG